MFCPNICSLVYHIDPMPTQKTQKGWNEVLIASGPDPTAPKILKSSPLSSEHATSDIVAHGVIESSPRFHRVLSETSTAASNLLAASSSRFQKMPVGSRIEVSPSAFKIAHRIGELLYSSQGGPADVSGCALVVDYGGDHAFGSSFRVGLLPSNITDNCAS